MTKPSVIDFVVENSSKKELPIKFLCASKEVLESANWGNDAQINIETHTIYTSYFEVLKQIEAKDLDTSGVRIMLSKSDNLSVKDFHKIMVKFNGNPKREEIMQSGCNISETVSDLFFDYKITKNDSIDFMMPPRTTFHITVFSKNC